MEIIYVDKTITPSVSWTYLRFHLFFFYTYFVEAPTEAEADDSKHLEKLKYRG